MSTFECKIYKAKIEAHPNADALELCRIGDYRAVVRKGDFTSGDMVAYIPEGAVLPQELIKEMQLEGRLAGSEKNRVKAVKLRGSLSQGLIYPARRGWLQGMDVAADLGVWKYEPPIPAGFEGELQNAGGNRTLKYDIENFKKFPDLFAPGEQVVMTEKLHGTFAMFAVMGNSSKLPGNFEHIEDERLIVASKGVGAKGLAFKITSPANQNNIYVRTARYLDLIPAVEEVFGLEESVFILGEIFGANVQDLSYGLKTPEFRIFDIYVGTFGAGRFLNDNELDQKCLELDIPRVPVLYCGPFSKQMLEIHTTGTENIGEGKHMREGVVVRPCVEREAGVGELPCYDRLQLKSVSEDYLLRKGNVTEYT